MARPFRFAVQALDLTDRNTVVAAARQAEALGYAEFYSYDHLGALDPFVPLVVAAEATSSLRVGPLDLNNEFHLGVRPDQARVPILVGGHGRLVIEAAAPLADIFQFTGLTHAADGTPLPGGFGIDMVTERALWLADATGDRNGLIERWILVQATHLGVGAEEASDRAAARLGLTREVVESTPFLLFGSVEQIVDKLESLREALGICHVVVRDAERFAPVAAALADR